MALMLFWTAGISPALMIMSGRDARGPHERHRSGAVPAMSLFGSEVSTVIP